MTFQRVVIELQRPSEGLKLRNVHLANAREYQQYVKEYQIEKQDMELEKFLFGEN